MLWQDYVIAIAQIGFIIALIPTLFTKDKPPVSTSFMNVIILAIITFCLFTLELYFSTVTASAIAITWAIVGFQKMKINKRNN